METQERETIAQWFADNWLLVAENDHDTYRELLEIEGDSVSVISDKLREEWEQLVQEVYQEIDDKISPIAGLFIAQLIQGWGSYPFDIIARRVLELKAGK